MPRGDIPEMGRQILTIPNVLSLLRLAMVPVVVMLLLARADLAAVIIFVLAAITDFLDGVLARRTQPTYVGKILDPVADRLMLSSTAIVLAIRGTLPVWAVAILVARDVFGLIGGLAFGRKLSVNRVGKAATALLMTAIALIIFSPGVIGEAIFYVGFGLSLIAAIMYLINISRVSGGGGAT
ncbi:MAG: CDP-alcohol phosphatidyltransferase family protein [Rubrobacteraceae bacterium]